MNKTAKGALAASAAAVLLAGGAGTLAFWSDSDFVDGGSVASGRLTIDATGCDATGWVHVAGPNAGKPVVKFVPGDSIKRSCTFVIGAQGDNLSATPTVPSTVAITSTAPTQTPLTATVAATYRLDGTALPANGKITQANGDNKTLTADLVVTFPYGSDTINGNGVQDVTATLDRLTVSLKQDLTAGNPNA